MTTDRNKENHKRFIKHLDESKPSIGVAKKHLESQGFEVREKETKKTPSYEERMKYLDDGDLEYYKDGEWRRVEVKHSSRNFTSAENWPFRNMFVCAIHSWDKVDPKPDVFLILSKDMNNVAEITGDTNNQWFLTSFTDKRYVNYRQTAYACPLDLIKFSTIDI